MRQDEFIVVVVVGPEGRSSLEKIEKEIGVLSGFVPGLFRPASLIQKFGTYATAHLFNMPSGLFARARLRENAKWFAPGCSYVVKNDDRSKFAWTGDEAAAKGPRMDSYPAPLLSDEWVERLIAPAQHMESVVPSPAPAVTQKLAANFTPPVAAPPKAKVRPNSVDLSKSNGRARLVGVSLYVDGAIGRKQLANLERLHGKIPSHLFVKNGGKNVHVFGVPEDRVEQLTQGQFQPGLTLALENLITPSICISEDWLAAIGKNR